MEGNNKDNNMFTFIMMRLIIILDPTVRYLQLGYHCFLKILTQIRHIDSVLHDHFPHDNIRSYNNLIYTNSVERDHFPHDNIRLYNDILST